VKDVLVNHTDQFGEWFHVPISERLFEGKEKQLKHCAIGTSELVLNIW